MLIVVQSKIVSYERCYLTTFLLNFVTRNIALYAEQISTLSYFLSCTLSAHKKADSAGKMIIAANIFTKNIKVSNIPIST